MISIKGYVIDADRYQYVVYKPKKNVKKENIMQQSELTFHDKLYEALLEIYKRYLKKKVMTPNITTIEEVKKLVEELNKEIRETYSIVLSDKDKPEKKKRETKKE